MSKNNWQDQTLLQIHREFSQTEKYKMLIAEFDQMKTKVDNYKKQMVKLQGAYDHLKAKYFELDQKYAALTAALEQVEYL